MALIYKSLNKQDHMMEVFLVLCCWLAYACKPCYCREYQESISCVGKNVSVLPTLNDTKRIKHVEILDTMVKDIQILSQWEHVETVEIRNNAELPCELVLNYTLSNPDILVVTDCDDYEPRILVEKYEEQPWWHVLILIPCVFVLCVAAYVKRQLALSKPELVTDTMFPMTSRTL